MKESEEDLRGMLANVLAENLKLTQDLMRYHLALLTIAREVPFVAERCPPIQPIRYVVNADVVDVAKDALYPEDEEEDEA